MKIFFTNRYSILSAVAIYHLLFFLYHNTLILMALSSQSNTVVNINVGVILHQSKVFHRGKSAANLSQIFQNPVFGARMLHYLIRNLILR